MGEARVFRWVLDVVSLWPSPPEYGQSRGATEHWATADYTKHALALLTPQEQSKVLRFYRPSDARLSLASCLLKHRAIMITCRVSWPEAVVGEDHNRKPCYTPLDADAKVIEFNVSHHGTLVTLVGCPGNGVRLGVDVVQMSWERDYPKVMRDGFEVWANVYEMVFSNREINDIAGFTPPEQNSTQEEIRAKLRHFYAHWCLKEAYVKMTGEALLAPWLKDLEFRNVQVPLPKSQMLGAPERGEWGQTCSDCEIWFHGTRVTHVKLEIQAFREDYMIGTASSDIDMPLSAFTELNLERDVYP